MTARLVAFAGPAGSGKSTAAAFLEEAGYHRTRFAAPLKSMLRSFLTHCALDTEEVERRVEGGLKEAPDRLLGGKTPREAMQLLGTEWGRDRISPDLWVGVWREQTERLLGMGISVVVEDCRFPNEAEAIRALGGAIVEVVGRGGIGMDHASERFEFEADYRIDNSGTPEELHEAVMSSFGPDGAAWGGMNEYEELALRVRSCADLDDATEIVRAAMEGIQDLWTVSRELIGMNEVEARTYRAMQDELAEATGRPTRTTPRALDVRPGITFEELRGVIEAFLARDVGSRRAAMLAQIQAHLGAYNIGSMTQTDRTRMAFFIDAWEAGVERSLTALDEALAAFIGGEQ